jgi:hypothetical protein
MLQLLADREAALTFWGELGTSGEPVCCDLISVAEERVGLALASASYRSLKRKICFVAMLSQLGAGRLVTENK